MSIFRPQIKKKPKHTHTKQKQIENKGGERMWAIATIINYRTIRVWFRDDIDVDFQPGMYILKGETTVLKLWKHSIDIKCKRLVIPTSYFSCIDIESWIYDFDLGYPVPFEIVSFPILTTSRGTWIVPTANGCVHELTQNATRRNKFNFQHRPNTALNNTSSHICHDYRPAHDFGSKLEAIFESHANMFPYCDEQLRKMMLFWPIDISLKTLTSNVYCDNDACFALIPCSIHT